MPKHNVQHGAFDGENTAFVEKILHLASLMMFKEMREPVLGKSSLNGDNTVKPTVTVNFRGGNFAGDFIDVSSQLYSNTNIKAKS